MSQLKERPLDNIDHMNKIQNIVEEIYSKALYTAKQGCNIYEYKVPYDYDIQTKRIASSNTFHVTYMNEILASLRQLFPDSRVVHTLLAQGSDGRLYDISALDDRALALVDRALNHSYIVIDWSKNSLL